EATLAVGFSLIAMLVYLWFRFELIYGVAAVVAVFHDTLITVGAFSLTNQEITLTVIAAILTLVGYSMNDTIVIFDRIRENVKLMRREGLAGIGKKSIKQTPSRAVLTFRRTYLTVLSFFIFGGGGTSRVFRCPGGRHPNRYVFVGRRSSSHACGLYGMASPALGSGCYGPSGAGEQGQGSSQGIGRKFPRFREQFKRCRCPNNYR